MLRNLNEILNYVLLAEDGEIGRCKDFLYDDKMWTIRYMVADTRKWLPGRKVLISPASLGDPDWCTKRFQVMLKRRQIETSPPLDEDAPVSRQYEVIFNAYYRTSPYWAGASEWGTQPTPSMLQAEVKQLATEFEGLAENHLRSIKEMTGYHIQASDSEIGHVEDFMVDDEKWALRYVVVNTRNWLPGRMVLVSPQWITSVNWGEKKLQVDLTTDSVRKSPEYETLGTINRDYECALHEHYGRRGYWEEKNRGIRG
jgi:hypothetical protein